MEGEGLTGIDPAMTSFLLGLLQTFHLGPVLPAEFPTAYEFYNGTELEYSNRYVWDAPDSLRISTRIAAGGERASLIVLTPDSRLLKSIARDTNGNPTWVTDYVYAGGLLRESRTGKDTTTFHYAGGNLDSAGVTRGGKLSEYYLYGYDAQGGPNRVDHFYDNDGGDHLRDFRHSITYFLPDSIVVKIAFEPADGDSTIQRIYLKDGNPVWMVESETYRGSHHNLTHLWAYAGSDAVSKRMPRRLFLAAAAAMGLPGIDLLGRFVPGSRSRP